MSESARYGLKFDSNAKDVGEQGASALESFRAKIEASQAAVKNYNETLRQLKGGSDEVVAAKAQLKAKVDAEKTAMSSASLAILKAGSSYDTLAKSHKKLSDEFNKGVAEKAKAEADRVKEYKDKMKQATEDANKKAEKSEEDLSAVFTKGSALAVTGILAVTAAIVGLGVKLFDFILTSGNVLRTQQITREAFVGNATDAEHLGNQIEELGRKVKTSRAELNEMANGLVNAGVKGQTLVDTLNATAQASAALGSGAGDKIKEFVERGRLSGRFSLGALETQGTGLQFQDVAKALAANTKTSVAEATQALIQGQVTLGAGAAALRSAVETRFGKTNLAQLLDIDNLKVKFKDTFEILTKDVNLDPLLKAFQSLMSLFDTSTETGTDIKELITWFGQGTVDVLAKGTPAIKGFVEALVGDALDLQNDYYDLRIQFQETFGKDVIGDIDLFSIAVTSVKTAFIPVNVVAGEFLATMREYQRIRDDINGISESVKVLYDRFTNLKWSDVGKSIVDGIIGPMKDIPNQAVNIGKDLIASFRNAVGSHSPSTEFADIGVDNQKGLAQGHERGQSIVDSAMDRNVDRMKSKAAGSSEGGGAGGVGGINVPIHIEYHAGNSKDGGDIDAFGAKIRVEVTQAIELALRQMGYA